jgi:hypothetical protein
MNRRDQTIVSDEALVAHIVKNYTYDRERGVVVNKKLRRVVKGSVNSIGYVKTRLWIGGQHPSIGLHHIVWVVVYGRFPTQIDHINGDKTDNRLENLREVNRSENDANRLWTWKPNARTGLPGVCQKEREFVIFVKKWIHFRDKYEAFFHSVLLGRMFKEN